MIDIAELMRVHYFEPVTAHYDKMFGDEWRKPGFDVLSFYMRKAADDR